MPAPIETTWVNRFLRFLLQGANKDGRVQDALIAGDRALVINSRLIGRSSQGERLLLVDPSDMLRLRPYEAILPVETAGPMPGTETTFYTSTGVRSRIYIELVNSDGDEDNTATVELETSGATDYMIYPGATVPTGVGTRLGHYDLEAGAKIKGLSTPANSIHIHVLVDRFSAAGDTP